MNYYFKRCLLNFERIIIKDVIFLVFIGWIKDINFWFL